MVEMGPRQIGVEKDPKSIKIKIIKKVTCCISRGLVWGGCPSSASSQKIAAKERQGGSGSGGRKTKRGGRKCVQCRNCGGDHFLHDCKEWKEIKEKLHSSLEN